MLPAPRLLLLLLLCAAAGAARAAPSCTASFPDCEANGECVAGRCACYRGWTGASCGSLDLLPAALPAARAWPLAAGQANASSWGFTRVFTPGDSSYHALVTVACGAAGVIGDGGGESWIAHLTSPSALGPWALSLAAPMFTSQTTFGPHIAVSAADGTLAAVFRVNALLNSSLCSGNSSGLEPPSLVNGAAIPPSALTPGDPEKGTSIYVATAAAMAGPWEVRKVDIEGGGGVHKSNPALASLHTPIGGRSWAMAYRDNPGKGERLALALAEAPGGPYVDVRNITFCSSVDGANNCEDPMVWQDARNATLAHMIYHNGPHGYHAVGALDGSCGWEGSPTGAFAYTLDVQLSTGGSLALLRRERPELQLRSDGSPELLITGVTSMDGATLRAWSLLQEVR
jgi:hypothetical protein